MAALLEVDDLTITFQTPAGEVPAVEGVSFAIGEGETLALVGESGCGKSVTCLALMRLLPVPPARVARGRVRLAGRDITALPEREMRKVRGREMAMIFQEPMTSFDPVFRIGDQLSEAMLAHEDIDPDEAEKRAVEAMAGVGLANPKSLAARYPHELSGGMKQRAMIAMALLENPRILLCDEPTTALDVTIQAQILDLLAGLREKRGMSMLFITHNLGIVAGLAQRAAVMYSGRVVELSGTAELYKEPLHPYTAGLFRSVPRLRDGGKRLESIPGTVPSPAERPAGCKFSPRCRRAAGICRESDPALAEKRPGRWCACHFA